MLPPPPNLKSLQDFGERCEEIRVRREADCRRREASVGFFDASRDLVVLGNRANLEGESCALTGLKRTDRPGEQAAAIRNDHIVT